MRFHVNQTRKDFILKKASIVLIYLITTVAFGQQGEFSIRIHDCVFTASAADSPDKQIKGLMHVTDMPSDRGMLFIFEPMKQASFWMKNTLIPLDIIFLDDTATITELHPNRLPETISITRSKQPIKYAIELNANSIRLCAIQTGDTVLITPTEQD